MGRTCVASRDGKGVLLGVLCAFALGAGPLAGGQELTRDKYDLSYRAKLDVYRWVYRETDSEAWKLLAFALDSQRNARVLWSHIACRKGPRRYQYECFGCNRLRASEAGLFKRLDSRLFS